MPTSRISWQRRSARAGRLLCLGSLLAGCTLVPGLVHAQPAAATSTTIHELSDAFSTEFGKLRPLLAAENPDYPDLLKKIDTIIQTMKLSGYDLAFISQIKMTLLVRSGEPLKAIKPLEDALVGDYFPPPAISGMTLALAQLYMQEAGTTNDEKVRLQRLGQAKARLEQWFTKNKEPLLGDPKMEAYADATMFYANALYFLKEFELSYEQSKKLVRMAIEPKDQSWVILFAAQQESGKSAEAAETFELFIRKFPEKKDVWMQLAQAYLNSDQTMRAILTYQRAQSHGFMSNPSDYQNIFSLYYRLEEYSRAAELWEGWLRSGKVEDNEDNWDLVAGCYQALRRDDRVRAIYESARKRFKTGNLDFQLAMYLWFDGKYKEGLEAAELAWKKGGLKKPGKAAITLALWNMEQRDTTRAKMFLEIAKKSADVSAQEISRAEGIIHPDTEADATVLKKAAEAAKSTP